MNRDAYIEALTFCFRAEAAGAIMGEVGMLLRSDPAEKHKVDLFRRVETTNMLLCASALEAEGVARPVIDPPYFRAGIELGLKLGEGDWSMFLDNFEATIHPELFTRYLPLQENTEFADGYVSVDYALLRHLVAHEQAAADFVAHERAGEDVASVRSFEQMLDSPTARRLAPAMEKACFVVPGMVS